MGLLLRRWRQKYSPAARRGRKAALELKARLEYNAWVAEQRTSLQRTDETAVENR